jgi:hypothetical protein
LITPALAARLLAMDYGGVPIPGVVEAISIDGVQSTIVDWRGERLLLIRGTNELRDWFRYNFAFTPQVGPGDRFQWHRGFLTHAQIAYAFAKGKGVEVVIGHSLGAAAAGIVAAGLSVAAITFATPRALFGEKRPEPGEVERIRNYCRIDDLVCMVPPALLGFSHLGPVHWLRTKGLHIGEEHRLEHYLGLLDAVS